MENREKESKKFMAEMLLETDYLIDESASALVIKDEVWNEVNRWVPEDAHVVARLVQSEYERCETFCYIVMTDERLYVANVLAEDIVCEEYRMVNVKCFKACDVAAYAFFTQPEETLELRLMMKDGKRIRLGLSIALIYRDKNYELLRGIAQSAFFKG